MNAKYRVLIINEVTDESLLDESVIQAFVDKNSFLPMNGSYDIGDLDIAEYFSMKYSKENKCVSVVLEVGGN